jgi:hypothetical protein
LKSGFAMSAVAERLILRMAAAAKSNRCPARQIKSISGRIANREFAFNSDRAIVVNGNFRQTILLKYLLY